MIEHACIRRSELEETAVCHGSAKHKYAHCGRAKPGQLLMQRIDTCGPYERYGPSTEPRPRSVLPSDSRYRRLGWKNRKERSLALSASACILPTGARRCNMHS